MRKQLFFLATIVLLISSVGANDLFASVKKENKSLLLRGEIDLVSSRSLPEKTPPIIAYQTDDAILVEITDAIGLINITISAGDNEVYNNSVSFKSPTQFMIYTGDYAPGTYLLEFCNTSCMYTEFTIE